MVTDAILDFFFGFIEAMFVLLPEGDFSIPEGPGWGVLSAANVVLPIDVFLTAAGIGTGVMTVGLGFWAVMKVINLVRGAGA